MPGFRPQRGGKPAGRGRGRGGGRGGVRGGGRGSKRGPTFQSHDRFESSRVRETEDNEEREGEDVDDEGLDAEDAQSQVNEDLSASEEKDETPTSNSYALLLQSLVTRKVNDEPPRKKRRTGWEYGDGRKHSTEGKTNLEDDTETAAVEGQPLEAGEDLSADEEDGQATDADSEDEELLLRDPFEKHYTTSSEQELKAAFKQVEEKEWKVTQSTLPGDIRRTAISRTKSSGRSGELKSSKEACLKRRLVDAGSKVILNLSLAERNVAGSIFNYVDVLNGCRDLTNASRLRDLSCLHALNHVLKTRDRVLKNNAKLSAQAAEALDLRDQGFARPKVLIVVPTKQACVRFVDSITKLSQPDQQENKARFLETYSREDEDTWQDKPNDFQELFGGNHEEDFRIGLKFTRKTIKYFSSFYNSDIIIGSPLGLMRTITSGGGGKESKKVHDADFLSSIEIVIVDHANALQMQNWQHIDYVFSQLNLLPKESHGCDFSRVRHWYLDSQAKYLRQTIVLSEYLTPEINSLASSHLRNIAGRVKYLPTYPGAMLSVSSLPVPFTSLPQIFLRIASPDPTSDSDARFKFFITTILPALVRDVRHQSGTLLFVPSYADFTRLRNHLSTSSDATSLSFGSLSEYTPVKDVMRLRAHFSSGRHALLLYSERAHHHFRYKIKGVKKILWYGVPENPIFWAEIISLLGFGAGEGGGKGSAKGVVRALFSRWDALKVERIIGTERVGRLIHDKGGDTFEFV